MINDRLLRCDIAPIFGLVPVLGRHKKGMAIMEYDYRGINALIRDARRQRSIALGDLLASLWQQARQALRSSDRDFRQARRGALRLEGK